MSLEVVDFNASENSSSYNDGGPAPLQTMQLTNVEFEGSLYFGDSMTSDYTNAFLALGWL
eukprot:1618501-Ditylum_brightwellii.AAC.1